MSRHNNVIIFSKISWKLYFQCTLQSCKSEGRVRDELLQRLGPKSCPKCGAYW